MATKRIMRPTREDAAKRPSSSGKPFGIDRRPISDASIAGIGTIVVEQIWNRPRNIVSHTVIHGHPSRQSFFLQMQLEAVSWAGDDNRDAKLMRPAVRHGSIAFSPLLG